MRLMIASLFALGLAACSETEDAEKTSYADQAPDSATVRVASFNMSLYRDAPGALLADLRDPGNAQLAALTEIVQRVRPDILLINEFDHDATGESLRLLREAWLAEGRNGAAPIAYPHAFTAPSNTGLPTGFDLDRDGVTDGPGDAQGFGRFEGQYGMAVLSRHPIDSEEIRTFQTFLWTDMPGALLPDDPETAAPADWYSADMLAVLRLSSKSHWDLPIEIDGQTLHLLASHPTPPAFDGPEDRNGRRNHDEIRFWADYLRPETSAYIHDDAGARGGLAPGARFVIAGDLNADPNDGDQAAAIAQLLEHPLIDAGLVPEARGGQEQAALQGGVNAAHRTPPRQDSADFNDDPPSVGNLRLDYVLPSHAGLEPLRAGIFWPASDDPLDRLVGSYPFASSDHRLVWIDLRLTM